jgi:hypothetical protein
MLLIIAAFLIGYGYYLLTSIPPDADGEVAALMAMAGKIAILVGCGKIALFALLYKSRSAHQSLLGRLRSRFSKTYVPKRIKRG